MKIVLIGSGNVATVLGKVMHDAGHEIIQVLSRNEHHAETLATIFQCPFGNSNTSPDQNADVYLLAITDTALYHFDQQMQFANKLVVHTAGSVSKEVLKSISSRYGVIYPLQTLVREAEQIPQIPFMVDGNNTETTSCIFKICEFLCFKCFNCR